MTSSRAETRSWRDPQSEPPTLEIQELDLVNRFIITADREVLPITNLVDGRGRPALSTDHAVLLIAGKPGRWLSVRLAAYDRRAFH